MIDANEQLFIGDLINALPPSRPSLLRRSDSCTMYPGSESAQRLMDSRSGSLDLQELGDDDGDFYCSDVASSGRAGSFSSSFHRSTGSVFDGHSSLGSESKDRCPSRPNRRSSLGKESSTAATKQSKMCMRRNKRRSTRVITV